MMKRTGDGAAVGGKHAGRVVASRSVAPPPQATLQRAVNQPEPVRVAPVAPVVRQQHSGGSMWGTIAKIAFVGIMACSDLSDTDRLALILAGDE